MTETGPSENVLMRAVGIELRLARQARGLTLAQIVDLLPSGIRVPTLAGYETGVRTFHVGRMVQICAAIGVSAPELLTAAMRRARMSAADMGVVIDLRSVVDDESANLGPLRQWARTQLAGEADAVTMVEPLMIRHMAGFCGLTIPAMAAELERFAPN